MLENHCDSILHTDMDRRLMEILNLSRFDECLALKQFRVDIIGNVFSDRVNVLEIQMYLCNISFVYKYQLPYV